MDKCKWPWLCGIVLAMSIGVYQATDRICESREREKAFENGYSQEVVNDGFIGGAKTIWVKK